MQRITSKENEFIKHVKKLRDKKYRDITNLYIIEGIKLVSEAIQEQAKIMQVILCDDCEKNAVIPKELMYEIAKYECIYVPEKIFKYLSEVQTPQGIIAVVEKTSKTMQIDYSQDIIVALDNLQDPGNLGTILRTVDSIGLNQIIISNQTADCYNPKVVRSTMGAIFRVKIINSEDLEKTLKEMKKHKFKIVASSLQAENTIYDIDYQKKVIVIGNESNGVEEKIQNLADEKVKIPMLRKNRKFKCLCCSWNYIVRICKAKIKIN